jgi:hypothetical protein
MWTMRPSRSNAARERSVVRPSTSLRDVVVEHVWAADRVAPENLTRRAGVTRTNQ